MKITILPNEIRLFGKVKDKWELLKELDDAEIEHTRSTDSYELVYVPALNQFFEMPIDDVVDQLNNNVEYVLNPIKYIDAETIMYRILDTCEEYDWKDSNEFRSKICRILMEYIPNISTKKQL